MASLEEIGNLINSASATAAAWYSAVTPSRAPIVVPGTSPQLTQQQIQAQSSVKSPTAAFLLSNPTTQLIVIVAGVALVVWALRRK